MDSHYSVDVNPERVNNSHSFIVQLVGTGKSVLELGAASGHVTQVLSSRGNTVTAVECDASNAEALSKVASDVIISDLDWLSFGHELKGKTFDVIVAGDVLEHTKRPELILVQLHSLLAPDGYLVVTLPHVGHGDVRLALLDGKFPYSDRGLLDRSHLRFFTRDNVHELFKLSGFRIDEIYGTTIPIGATELGIDLSSFSPDILARVTNATDSDVYQFVVKAAAVEVPGLLLDESTDLTRTRSQVDFLAEVSALNKTIAGLRNQIASKDAQLYGLQEEKRHHEISQLEAKDYAIGILAELGEAKSKLLITESLQQETMTRLANEMTRAFNAEARVIALESSIAELRHVRVQLHALRRSPSFRLGRAISAPLRLIRKPFK